MKLPQKLSLKPIPMSTIKEETEEELDESRIIKIIIKSGEAFTPYQIKKLSYIGKKNMGYYGISVYIFVGGTTILNLYKLITSNTELIVIINLMIPSIISLLALFRGIAGILHFLLKQFK